MKDTTKTAIIVVLGTVLGLTLTGRGPIGAMLYPPLELHGAAPPTYVIGLLMGYTVLSAVAFGAGIAFLVRGRGLIRGLASSRGKAVAAQLSIAWILMSFVPHDSLHQAVGENLSAIVVLEYVFHLTVMLAGVALALFFLDAVRNLAAQRRAAFQPAAQATRS